MDAKLDKKGEISIITIQGPLNIDKTHSFREYCIRNFVGQKIIFNMHNATFVGSTGLQAFFETVRTLNEESEHGLKLVGLKPEFRRIFQNMELSKLQIYDSLDGAVTSFSLATYSTTDSTLD